MEKAKSDKSARTVKSDTADCADKDIQIKLGEDLKAQRLQRNFDRETFAAMAGISKTALRNLEGGKGVTLQTLIAVVRVLGRQDWFRGISPRVYLSPVGLLRDSSQPRRRASYNKRTYTKIIMT